MIGRKQANIKNSRPMMKYSFLSIERTKQTKFGMYSTDRWVDWITLSRRNRNIIIWVSKFYWHGYDESIFDCRRPYCRLESYYIKTAPWFKGVVYWINSFWFEGVVVSLITPRIGVESTTVLSVETKCDCRRLYCRLESHSINSFWFEGVVNFVLLIWRLVVKQWI